MKKTLSEFYELLSQEEFFFNESLAKDNLGVYLRGAINELDWYIYNYSREKNRSDEQREYYYLLLIGTTRLIQLALDSREAFDVPVVLFLRTKKRSKLILDIVAGLGIIEHGRRVAQSVEAGLATIKKDGEYKFTITVSDDIPEDSYFESRVSEHFTAESRRSFALMLETDKWRATEKEVNLTIEKLVYPFQKHFMGYDADPLLDGYFFGLAYHEIQLQAGFDSFNGAVKFGTVSFRHYILAVTYITAVYKKHKRFAEVFSEKEYHVHLENILTITSKTDGFVESIKDALNYFGQDIEGYIDIDLASAKEIYAVISCSRSNTEILSAPGSPLPFLVQCSDQGVIQCIAGVECEPIRYLLESLKHAFPKDYDRNQRTREKSFQKAIQRILEQNCDDLEFRENVKIKLDGNITTDIDIAILEKQTGQLILCQLKHQELYGINLHAKKVRTERLVEYSKKWLNAVDSWLSNVDESDVRSTLRISKECPKLVINKMILTKHFSFPLKDIAVEYETEYSNWPMFVNSILLAKQTGNTIGLKEILNFIVKSNFAYETPSYLEEPLTEWKLRKLNFSTVSASVSV